MGSRNMSCVEYIYCMPPCISRGSVQHIKKCQEILGEAIEYSKTQRSLVLEFKAVDDAIEALNYLPFGLNYQIYLLDA